MERFHHENSPEMDKIAAGLLDKDTKIVISFDGGGVRGIISLIIAEALEDASGVPLSLSSDLLIGTSIGGIISLFFSLPDDENSKIPKYKASEVTKNYYEFGKRIFTSPMKETMKSLWGLQSCKYPSHTIDQIMQEFFKSTPMSQAINRVTVVGAEIERYTPFLLKSYKNPNVFMRDAALATAAAPTYFPVARFTDASASQETSLGGAQEVFSVIDGGITGANNPSLMGYVELCNIYKDIKNIKEKVIVISIGTGLFSRKIKYEDVAEGGKLTWMPHILHMFRELTGGVIDYQLDHLLTDIPIKGKGLLRRYWRFQPFISEDLLAIDNATDDNLKALADVSKNYVREHAREIEFLGKILAQRAKYIKAEKNIS